MAQGPVDHPAYLVRQMLRLGPNGTGGAGSLIPTIGTAGLTFPFDVRIRNAVAVSGSVGVPGNGLVVYSQGTVVAFPQATVVNSIGTVTGTFSATATFTTTQTLGFVSMGTTAVGTAQQSGDMNFRLPAGQGLLFKNGTGATGGFDAAIEWHIDPQSGVWTGGN